MVYCPLFCMYGELVFALILRRMPVRFDLIIVAGGVVLFLEIGL